MNRRTLLLLSTLLGGLAPIRLLAQEPSRRSSSRSRAGDDPPRTARNKLRDDPDPPADEPDPPAADRDDVPPNLPSEPGHQWRTFNIAKYTGLPHDENNPQNKIVEWIYRRTSTAPWFGEKIAVLAAGRSKLKVYQNAKILDQVDEVVERFIDAQNDFLSLRVRFVAAANPRWRAFVYNKLNLIGTGPQGQQIWNVRPDDAAMIYTQMQIMQGFLLIADQQHRMINGQTLKLSSTKTRQFVGGMQRDGAAAPGFQPAPDKLEEGVTLRISPLLSYEGDALDAALELTSNNVRTLHPTRVLAPRQSGPGELSIDVPEVSETNLNQTVRGWSLRDTLLISGGIQPGLLQPKDGLFKMRIPGTVPTSTELLVFLNIELAEGSDARRDAKGRSKR